MYEDNADTRGNAHRISRIESSDQPADQPAGAIARRTARVATALCIACIACIAWVEWQRRRCITRGGALSVLCMWAALHGGAAHAQDPSMLDERITQQSVSDTICKPGYADTVSPPVDEMMAHKNRLLAERGIDAVDSTAYALDRRVPIVLGGSPDAVDNFDLLPWGGHRGER